MSREEKDSRQDGGKSRPWPEAPFDVKRLQCWYWTQGGCTWSDDECRYAHYYTGKIAERPIMRANGYSVAGRNATMERPIYRKWQGSAPRSSIKPGESSEGARPGTHEQQQPGNSHSTDLSSYEYANKYHEYGIPNPRSSSDRKPSLEPESIRGRYRLQASDDAYGAGHRWPRARSRSPYTGHNFPASRERSPTSSTPRKEKRQPDNEATITAAVISQDPRQTSNASKNEATSKGDNNSTNTKPSLALQAQTASSRVDNSAHSLYTFPLPKLLNTTKAEESTSAHIEASHPPPQTPKERTSFTMQAMEPPLEAMQHPPAVDEKAADNDTDHLHGQLPLSQQYSQMNSHYHGMQITPQRNTFGFHEPTSTMVTMTMGQYNQIRAQQDHMKRELCHYHTHHRRAEQVIRYQGVLLTEAQSLLESGKKLLSDEGRLAMDLSQKIQRGDTIHPDLVTDAWLGATDMLRQSDDFSTMLDEWSRAVTLDRMRNASTSSIHPAGELANSLPTSVGNHEQQE